MLDVLLIVLALCMILTAVLVPINCREQQRKIRASAATGNESPGFSEEKPNSPRALFVVKLEMLPVATTPEPPHAWATFYTASTPTVTKGTAPK